MNIAHINIDHHRPCEAELDALAELDNATDCDCLPCRMFVADYFGVSLASVVPTNGTVH